MTIAAADSQTDPIGGMARPGRGIAQCLIASAIAGEDIVLIGDSVRRPELALWQLAGRSFRAALTNRAAAALRADLAGRTGHTASTILTIGANGARRPL